MHLTTESSEKCEAYSKPKVESSILTQCEVITHNDHML